MNETPGTDLRLVGFLTPAEIAGNTVVREETCAASGCHEGGGSREISFGPVTFTHRDHGGDSLQVAMSCAGCHIHEIGNDPLVADVGTCALCHIAEQTAGIAGECRLCHSAPEHVAVTSQAVAVPHDGLPYVDGGCVRCHYDVTETTVEVSPLTCGTCHADGDELLATDTIPAQLHTDHTGVGCVSCHVTEGHQIQAMSTAVVLDCAQCHSEIHEVPVTREWPGTSTCNACHAGSHAAEQRMVLGLVDPEQPIPSDKFMSGLSCASCHVAAEGADPAVAVAGSAEGCVGCHRGEYAEVLDWWIEGSADRTSMARAAVDRAQRTLGADVAPLDSASARIDAVRDGGAHHNLLLAHRLLEGVLADVTAAYEASGRSAPAAPSLGREPSMGLCSYCHYRVDEPWLFQDMSGAFHREVMVRGQGR
ncbi:MAG: hypothetical protein KJO11_13040 [Gemmatimonadetes bacterium]|nr:hypothetical protein [Gemmatimonadota bacterium]MBT8403125.1 hypothetical protein [Gemmatimonadota bacterium]